MKRAKITKSTKALVEELVNKPTGINRALNDYPHIVGREFGKTDDVIVVVPDEVAHGMFGDISIEGTVQDYQAQQLDRLNETNAGMELTSWLDDQDISPSQLCLCFGTRYLEQRKRDSYSKRVIYYKQ